MASESRQNAREALVATALELLDRDHPEDLSIREVARRTGLTSGAPYHHFGDKLGLLAACAEVAWSELCGDLERIDAAAPVEAKIQHQASAYVAYALSHPGPYRLMTSRLLDDDERFEEIAAWRMRAMRGLVALIAQSEGGRGSDPKQPWRRAMAVWALLHGHVTLVLDKGISAESMDGFSEETCRLAARLAVLPVEDR